MRTLFIGIILISKLTNAQSPFDAIESAHWHQASNTWFVSSLGGGKVTLEKDGYGWLTRLDENGKVIKDKWIEGLNAPTGIYSTGDFLYVADRGEVIEISVKEGKILRKIKLKDSEFINDVAAAENGDVYVSDTFKDRIYLIRKGKDAEVFIESSKLEYPNGLFIDGDYLIVATWGPMIDKSTFTTSKKGKVLKVNLQTKEIMNLGSGAPIANFDGIVKVGNYYYGTDWIDGKLLKISETGSFITVAEGFYQLADLGYNAQKKVLGIPEMSSNRIYFIYPSE